MAEIIKLSATTETGLVHSPDDGGFYFKQFARLPGLTRVSVKLFSSREEALRALKLGTVKWERWS